jgi:hypothetical protein
VTLHITNGDHAGNKLRGFVNGPVTLACDVLHEGPCPPVDGDAWHEVRARFLASGDGQRYENIKAGMAASDAAIAQACEQDDEIVLWFEHDLFDQLALIRTLDLMVRLKPDTTETRQPDITETEQPGATEPRKSDAAETRAGVPVVSGFSRTLPRVSLICIGAFPGIDRFIGLGQLTAEQLATLVGTGVTVTAGHFRLAVDAWCAFRSPDPSELLHIAHQLSAAHLPVSEGGPALPFLGDALLRMLAEYPSTANGLSWTEQLALRSLLDGPMAAGALFGATQAHEARPFMGDSTFFDVLQRLASARVPLVTVDAATNRGDPRVHIVAISDAGRRVLGGRADHIGLNGIDAWRGGAHLDGSGRSPWRWDSGGETLVS